MVALENAIVDLKLLSRDSQPGWSSPLGRVVQVGDRAHIFVPSFGTGLVQVMGDAITLATCLNIGESFKAEL